MAECYFSLQLRKDFRLIRISWLTPVPGSLVEWFQRTRFHRCFYGKEYSQRRRILALAKILRQDYATESLGGQLCFTCPGEPLRSSGEAHP